MEDRTQIKFSNPEIDGTPCPQLITLEQNEPIEGTSERETGESFVWHKWLCINNQYFMESKTLNGMLRLIPNKTGKPLKIEKVLNPKGGFPFFQINGMNKDDILREATDHVPPMDTIDPLASQPATAPASNSDGSLARLEQKVDQIIQILSSVQTAGRVADSLAPHRQPPVEAEELPF